MSSNTIPKKKGRFELLTILFSLLPITQKSGIGSILSLSYNSNLTLNGNITELGSQLPEYATSFYPSVYTILIISLICIVTFIIIISISPCVCLPKCIPSILFWCIFLVLDGFIIYFLGYSLFTKSSFDKSFDEIPSHLSQALSKIIVAYSDTFDSQDWKEDLQLLENYPPILATTIRDIDINNIYTQINSMFSDPEYHNSFKTEITKVYDLLVDAKAESYVTGLLGVGDAVNSYSLSKLQETGNCYISFANDLKTFQAAVTNIESQGYFTSDLSIVTLIVIFSYCFIFIAFFVFCGQTVAYVKPTQCSRCCVYFNPILSILLIAATMVLVALLLSMPT